MVSLSLSNITPDSLQARANMNNTKTKYRRGPPLWRWSHRYSLDAREGPEKQHTTKLIEIAFDGPPFPIFISFRNKKKHFSLFVQLVPFYYYIFFFLLCVLLLFSVNRDFPFRQTIRTKPFGHQSMPWVDDGRPSLMVFYAKCLPVHCVCTPPNCNHLKGISPQTDTDAIFYHHYIFPGTGKITRRVFFH